MESGHSPDLIAAARQALAAGDREHARRMLGELLRDDKRSMALSAEQQSAAWMLLAQAVDQPDRKRYCIQRAAMLQQGTAFAQEVQQEQEGEPAALLPSGKPAASSPQLSGIAQDDGSTQASQQAATQAAPAPPVKLAASAPRKRFRVRLAVAITSLIALAALIRPDLLGLAGTGMAGPALLEPAAWSAFFEGVGSYSPGAEQPLAALPLAPTALPTLGLPRPPTWTPTASPPPGSTVTPRPTINVFEAGNGPVASITPFWGEWKIIIGYSVEGRPLEVVRFGTGKKERMIVAGIHGGDEFNTIKLADELITHVRRRPGLVPPGYTLYILRALNPDGEARDHSPKGRYNANGVDLNRNFDTNWKSAWRLNGCSSAAGTGGSGPGSEPETKALKAFLSERNVEALISYHSAGLGVFPSGDPAHPGSIRLAESISAISKYIYPPVQTGCEYTGTLVDWAADHGVTAAVDLELNSLNDTEFETNRKVLELLMRFDTQQ